MTAPRSPVVVIGIGNSMRRDDGAGPATIATLRASETPLEADLVQLDGEVARLIECWHGRRLAVVIDAARAGSPPGTIHRLEPKVDDLPHGNRASSHAAGLVEAVALARALEREPARLVVYGVEPGDLDRGSGLSPAVAAVLPHLAERIRDEIHSSL